MKNYFIFIASLVLALTFSNQVFSKDEQRSHQVMRVVSVSGGITEIIYELGAGDMLVGVDTTSIYPEAAHKIAKVGYMRALSVEGVASLKPDYVFLSAAKVGGILANNLKRAEFIFDNLSIQSNIIHQSYLNGVKKLLFLGSSCIYPKFAPQPMKENVLLTGILEPTNEPYAIAKIAGIKMCQAYHDQYGCNFISLMPTNLYGPNDNYDLQNSHVLPALIRKFHEAKLGNKESVQIWGTGNPKREFLHVDDLADACLFLM